MPAHTQSPDPAAPITNPEDDRLRFHWHTLPAATAHLPGTGGTLRTTPDDFIVSEIPSYLPSGSGAHAYAHVEKRSLTTTDLLSALTHAGVPRATIGFAGQKDKYAITRQWLSVPAEYAHTFSSLDNINGVKVLQTSLHRNKLGLGHLQANQFSIRVRNVPHAWQPIAEQILAHLQAVGLPNYFGPQRFGRFNTNAADALRIASGKRIPGNRRLHRFYYSALQSQVFNHLLKLRIEQGLYTSVLTGDRAQKHTTGGMFVVEDANAESQRSQQLEISAALPLYGKKVRISSGDAGALEQRALDELGLEYDHFRKAHGARRISRIKLKDTSLTPTDDGYTIYFTLPKGAYATTLMRELTKSPNIT